MSGTKKPAPVLGGPPLRKTSPAEKPDKLEKPEIFEQVQQTRQTFVEEPLYVDQKKHHEERHCPDKYCSWKDSQKRDISMIVFG